MPFRVLDDTVFLEGHCSIEEAEALHEALKAIERPVFDLGTAGHLHTAIVQLLMLSGGTMRSLPADPVLEACLAARPPAADAMQVPS